MSNVTWAQFAACHNGLTKQQGLGSLNIRDILCLAPVIAAVPPLAPAQAVLAARALLSGGLRVLEINLHGTDAIASIDAIRKAVPDAVIGVSGLAKAADFAAAGRVGAHFGVTPGFTAELAAATRGARFPVTPGVMTPSDVVAAQHAGFKLLTLFPAELAGGVRMLEMLGETFPDLEFYAKGGISRENAVRFLAVSRVLCVGGSWIAAKSMIDAADWPGIEATAKDAASLTNTRLRASET